MNIYAAIPLASFVGYVALIGIIISRSLARVHRLFIMLSLVAALSSFSSFVIHAEFFPEQTLLWNRGLLILGSSISMVFYHFTRAFFNRPAGKFTFLGYIGLVGFSIFIAVGGLLKSSIVEDGILYWEYDSTFYFLAAFSAIYMSSALYFLIQGFRQSTDHLERNRLVYLISAICVWIFFYLTNLVPVLANYSVDHIGNIAFSLIIGYSIMRHQLMNVRLIMRTVVVWALMVVFYGGIFSILVVAGNKLFPDQPVTSAVIASGLTLLMVIFGRRFRNTIEKGVGLLFYRNTYHYRQALMNFSNQMGNILNLNELADNLLPSLSQALGSAWVNLMFKDSNTSDFNTQYTYPRTMQGTENGLSFTTDNPILIRLDREDGPLFTNQIDGIPQLKGLWEKEKEKLANTKVEFLFPIKSRGKLIGILALGPKQSGAIYSHDDIELVKNMASQAGVIMENAHLYSQAIAWATTDGLTELYNHRHFHERINQEIARCSRFGTIFSLIMLDLDLFKAYNDTYGHLAGDEVLRKISQCIEISIRSIDTAFRYGGEEFAIILPETRLDDAYKVAERIRKTIEANPDSKAMPTTASLGIASWPIDGVMKEEIIARADAALYQAKRTGRNKTSTTTDITKAEEGIAEVESENKERALSIIYALAATVDAKDHYTYGHSKKVSQYAVTLSEALRLPNDTISIVRAAGMLHDIGKISVPDSILNKRGPLTEEESQTIKAHPELGVEIVRHIADLANCLPAILHHHEHYNGRGYPSGLKGNNIPLEARVLAIADAYDAMTSSRPYREQLTSQQASAELYHFAGTQFDPDMVPIFCKTIELSLPEVSPKKF